MCLGGSLVNCCVDEDGGDGTIEMKEGKGRDVVVHEEQPFHLPIDQKGDSSSRPLQANLPALQLPSIREQVRRHGPVALSVTLLQAGNILWQSAEVNVLRCNLCDPECNGSCRPEGYFFHRQDDLVSES